jgi:hypothetical protein
VEDFLTIVGKIARMEIGDWGLRIGDWGLGIGDWGLGVGVWGMGDWRWEIDAALYHFGFELLNVG